MAQLQTFDRYVSNVVVYGVQEGKGYPFETPTVTMQAGMKAGALLKIVSNKYVWAAKADAANIVGVLADSETQFDGELGAVGDFPLVVAVRACGLGKNYLNYSDGAVDAAGIAKLLTLSMKVEDQY